jgi:hypothetical protein
MVVNRYERFKQFRKFIHGVRQTDRFIRIESIEDSVQYFENVEE